MKTFRFETRNIGTGPRSEYCANRALSESRPALACRNRRRTDRRRSASVTGWLWLAAVALLVYGVLS